MGATYPEWPEQPREDDDDIDDTPDEYDDKPAEHWGDIWPARVKVAYDILTSEAEIATCVRRAAAECMVRYLSGEIDR